MKIYTLGLATVAAILMSQLSAPLPPNNAATSSYKLDQATFTLNQSGSNLTFEIEDNDPLAIDRIVVNGQELMRDEAGLYKFEMGQKSNVEVSISSDSARSSESSDPIRHITSRTFPLGNLGLSEAAFAQSPLATRTRIRYQTFIGLPFVFAVPGCSGNYINIPLATYFNGNSRSWDANSAAYKTRFDTIISWGTDPAVTKEVSVGPTIAYGGIPPALFSLASETASSQSMTLTTSVLSPTYVSYRINQRVVNPFCSNADGIRFGLNFFVRQDGVYTMDGNYLPVPHHEAYARDNVDTSWRQILREGSDNFPCLLPVISSECDINIKQRSAF
jgi:hypothetical protein